MANENDMKTSTAAGPNGTPSPVKSPVDVPGMSTRAAHPRDILAKAEASVRWIEDFFARGLRASERDEVVAEVAAALSAERERCTGIVRKAGFLEPDDRAALIRRMVSP